MAKDCDILLCCQVDPVLGNLGNSCLCLPSVQVSPHSGFHGLPRQGRLEVGSQQWSAWIRSAPMLSNGLHHVVQPDAAMLCKQVWTALIRAAETDMLIKTPLQRHLKFAIRCCSLAMLQCS